MKIQGLVVAICFALNCPFLQAESFTTNIIDGIGTNAGPLLRVGATGPYNFLLITNGGGLTNGLGIVGDAPGADHNAAIVTGGNSFWNSPNFILGNTGAFNQVSVLNGGSLFIEGLTAFGEHQTSRSNVMLLAGQGSLLNLLAGLRIGLFGSENGLVIRDGACASTGLGIIGYEETAHGNFAVLDGPGSLWLLPRVTVGRASGSNWLHILNGATVTNANSTVGDFPMARGNRALVSGPGSVWNTQMGLAIGSNGPNSLVEVTDGAQLAAGVIGVGVGSSFNQLTVRNAVVTDGFPNAAGMTIGAGAKSYFNVVTFDGPGARGTNDRTFVGLGGRSNSLVILNGAEFTVGGASAAPEFVVGAGEFSDGNSVEISGAGSKLLATVPFRLGGAGLGNRLLVDGGLLLTSFAQIGNSCGANNNAIVVRGSGALWTNAFLHLGVCGMSNSLTITDGAQVLSGRLTSTFQRGGGNKIEVSGPGSLLRAETLSLGYRGSGDSLRITDGGRVASMAAQIGTFAANGSNNFALVSGAGSSWNSIGLDIGGDGIRNFLRVDNGASVEIGRVGLGGDFYAVQNGIYLVGPDTRLNTTNVSIGGFGRSNYLVVSGGAALSSHDIRVGGLPGGGVGTGDLNVFSVVGSNSLVIATNNVVVGFQGRSNRLEVLDGGQIHSLGRGVIGENPGLRNSAIVSGPHSVWFMTNELVVGERALASSLVVSNGGFVRSQSGHVGTIGEGIGGGVGCPWAESASRVYVTGHSSLWAIAESLVVGSNAISNSLLITNGGRVVARDVIIGVTDGGRTCGPGIGTNALFLNEVEITGGNLDLDMNAVNTFEVRYGTLRLRSGVVNVGQLLMTNRWSRLEHLGGSLTCSEAVVDNRLPLVIGDGLHNASFRGGDITAPGGIVVRDHALLESSGKFNGALTNFGTLSPLNFGTFAASNYYQQPAGTLLIDIALQKAELLSVSNVALLNGKLRLRQDAGPPSNAVAIIAAGAVIGTFNNVTNGGRLKTADNLGSYIVEYAPTSVVIRDYESTDLDGDGIEDAWATRHFGHTPLTPAEKSADADGDGASNYDEFVAGTDPENSTSVLRASISYANGAATVVFPFQEEKRYRILWSSDLVTWSEVFDPTFSFPEPGLCRWSEDGRSTVGPVRLFRVQVLR